MTAVTYSESPTVLLPADLATIANGILQDNINPGGVVAGRGQTMPGAFNYMGILTFPGGRGSIKVYPGDVIAIDNLGWPTVVSAASIASAVSWTFT